MRRFTNERAQADRELRALYETVAAKFRARTPDRRAIVRRMMELPQNLQPAIAPALETLLDTLVAQHEFMFELPPFPETMDLAEEAAFKNRLLKSMRFFDAEQAFLDALDVGLFIVAEDIAKACPTFGTPSPFTIPVLNAFASPKALFGQIFWQLCDNKIYSKWLFKSPTDRIYANTCIAAGYPPREATEEPPGKLVFIDESRAPLQDWAKTYLSGTPYESFLKTPVPLKLTHEDRFNHWHVVGGTGAGKTTLLENLILYDLKSEAPPALVVIDSQGDLIRKLTRLKAFDPDGGRFADRFVLVSPKDIDHPPALNIFDVNRARLGRYDATTKEQVVAGVIQTFDYLFSGLLGADLTAKQGVFFKYVARLMLALPETLGRNATILDMMRLMEDPAPYRAAIESLAPLQRQFFERDFSSKTFTQTKEQIRYRLQAIIENPTLARLFTAPETKLDLFAEMNRGSIILVDTAKDFLKGASAHFGRIFISLVLQAVLERAALPQNKRFPVFLIVDEAAAYFDDNIDDLLTEARKYRCGCVFAHQYLDQTSSGLRASLAANTGIKFAAGVSNSDARFLSTDMRTTTDFILNQPRLHFAAHIRNVTPSAVSIPVRPGLLDREPHLDDRALARLLARNAARVSLGPEQPAPPDARQPPRPSPQPPSDEVSSEW